jgi:hypothetical protein
MRANSFIAAEVIDADGDDGAGDNEPVELSLTIVA